MLHRSTFSETDYNNEIFQTSMQQFCESYFLEDMVKKPTCFKNPARPTRIDLIITNKLGIFRNVKSYETGLSDFHKLVVSIMKLSYKKRPPHMINYRDYKSFSNEYLKNSLNEKLVNNPELDYSNFEVIVLNLLSFQAPPSK